MCRECREQFPRHLLQRKPLVSYSVMHHGRCVTHVPWYIPCLIIIIKSELRTITHCLRLGHETMECVVCLSIFLWICDMAGLLHGTFVSWRYLPWIWPPVTDIQHYYHARYPTDDWHLAYMFLLVYFSVEVCLEGMFPHSVSTRLDPCVRVHYAPLTLPTHPHERTKSNRGDPALHLHQERGAFELTLGGNLGCWMI